MRLGALSDFFAGKKKHFSFMLHAKELKYLTTFNSTVLTPRFKIFVFIWERFNIYTHSDWTRKWGWNLFVMVTSKELLILWRSRDWFGPNDMETKCFYVIFMNKLTHTKHHMSQSAFYFFCKWGFLLLLLLLLLLLFLFLKRKTELRYYCKRFLGLFYQVMPM